MKLNFSSIHSRRGALGALILAAVLGSNAAMADPPWCDMRLSVELTPDVPDPRDVGFLSSLLSVDPAADARRLRHRSGADRARPRLPLSECS
jgi:hypothetical protein